MEALVADLIDENLKQWKQQLFFSSSRFNAFEAKQIMSIPIFFRLPEDKMIWDPEHDGCYLMKLSYH